MEHNFTVLYHPRAPLEIAVAHLLDGCQAIECDTDIRSAIAGVPPTRSIILFGDDFDLTQIKQNLTTFEQVKVFRYESDAYGEAVDGITVFDASDFHQHVPLTGAASLLAEYFLCIVTDHESPMEGINEQTGQYLLDGMGSESEPFRDVIMSMNGLHGLDKIADYIHGGKVIENYNIKRRISRILSGIHYELTSPSGKILKILAVDDTDKLFNTPLKIPAAIPTDFIVTYAASASDNGIFWRVGMFQVNGAPEDVIGIMPSDEQKITPEEMKIIIPPLFT